jgi:GNAT superfamily N-acetyltransferase
MILSGMVVRPEEYRLIDTLTMDDAADAAGLSAAFGWPHRVADWALFLRLGHGFAWREGSRLVGTAMWFPLTDRHASIGLVQVAPHLQGRGVGGRLMAAVMAAAAPRSLMLHATAEGAGLYARLGFTPGGVVQQWQGEFREPPAPGAVGRLATPADRAAIARLDIAATGLARDAITDELLQAGAVAVTGPAGDLTGYAVHRPFGRGTLVGPMIAEDEPTAVILVATLCTPGFLRVDVPAEAASLIAWLGQAGLSYAGEVQLMTRGEWPLPRGPARRVALASQALG